MATPIFFSQCSSEGIYAEDGGIFVCFEDFLSPAVHGHKKIRCKELELHALSVHLPLNPF